MTDDARKSLLDLLDHLKSFAEEAAAARDASEEHERALAEDVDLLCGSEEDVEPPGLPDTGAVMSLIQIIDDYEKLARSTWRRPKAQKIAPIGPFVPNGVVHLQTVLIAALDLGGHALKSPMLRAQVEKLQKLIARGLEARQQNAIEIKKLVWQMDDNGRTPQQIQGDLLAKKIKRSPSWIYATINERKSTES
jgi:hypothetical protein